MSRKLFAWLALAPAAALSVAAAGCNGDDKQKVDVSVSCRTPVEFEVPLGVFNAPVLGLGDVILLNGETRKAERVTRVALSGADEKTIGDQKEKFDAELEFDFSGSSNDTAEAHVKSKINGGTELEVEAAKRLDYDLEELHAALNADDYLKREMERAQQKHDPGTIHFFVVGTEVDASHLGLKATQGTEVEGGGAVIGYGNFEFTVKYHCDAELNRHADEGSAVFFKPGFLKLEGSGAQARVEFDHDFHESLVGYDWTDARRIAGTAGR